MASARRSAPLDGNTACARVAYALSEVVAIYPITPSSSMGELADAWAAAKEPNLWGSVPVVYEMQSEAGVAGAIHGALSTGALATTFTASQGLLLMIPNLYKIAGELTPFVLHVAARSVAAQALSIFGDHSDVMAARQTGCAMLASASVQEAQDLAVVAHMATLRARLPFIHFFDGFRTSHEIRKIEVLDTAVLNGLIDAEAVRAHRGRGLTPDAPAIRGTAQNPDVFFQARESVEPFYRAAPGIVREAMDAFAAATGRRYDLFDYTGAPDAERVVVMMGSGAGAAAEAVAALNAAGAKTGLLQVRLYRPFDAAAFVDAIPKSAKAVAVLDRTKEPGGVGEPLFLDVVAALTAARGAAAPKVIGGRYGLSSKEFTPAMAAAVLAELAKPEPKPRFTVGIVDDVSGSSLEWDPEFDTEDARTRRAVFFGLGSDGTVGANKNSIKIIAERTDWHAQGYFVYDSKKSGAMTVSHLRFGPQAFDSTYLISRADFVACHQETLLERVDVLGAAAAGAVFLLNTVHGPDRAWDALPLEVQRRILDKRLRFFVVDGYKVAREAGLGPRINTVMQACFFEITKLLDGAVDAIKEGIEKSYGKKSRSVVEMNFKAVDAALAHLHEVRVPVATTGRPRPPLVPDAAPDFVRDVTARIMAGEGDRMPVSAFPPDGTYPSATSRWEKRNIAQEIPVWDERWCIQCNKCALVCPHAAIRVKAYSPDQLGDAPETFKSVAWRGREFGPDTRYTVQVAPADCTGCGLCVEACPAKNKTETRLKAVNMEPQLPLRESESANFDFFLKLRDAQAANPLPATPKHSQLAEPRFEFSGACAGCGETPYLKLATQLFGDRMLVANATGCSSIYGGNLPTTPWSTGADGRGPAWSNSLFEDNAEFGLGFRLTLDKQRAYAGELLERLAGKLDARLVEALRAPCAADQLSLAKRRADVEALRAALRGVAEDGARDLESLAGVFTPRSVWIVGGDGWAYDIGYGGLDHALASGLNVNILVLDTEVYSNTGGQASKATPRAAVAKFAAAGKPTARKDLAGLAMSYGSVYVAQVALGASDAQTVQAFVEAESYPGTSLIIAYSHCIAHGINMREGMLQQKRAVDSGYWPLLRYDPRRRTEGKKPLRLDSGDPKIPFKNYAYRETRYRMLSMSHPQEAERLLRAAERDAADRRKRLKEDADES